VSHLDGPRGNAGGGLPAGVDADLVDEAGRGVVGVVVDGVSDVADGIGDFRCAA